ncbi:hypothetical protein THAOC_04900 [Thalassiosira oceanica]|uniref:Uncharacterized protein n=1 Tax=Thalassiosira oceanica TaxID=159749 RepID=K0T8N5_THAOC|nr:hypothetical protein THAOC_04900 [Thalassiosira oceanica]|eukprot:EJK73474.1 hypothetical protein THAOC_04900 [Thalassiosira oceanica]
MFVTQWPSADELSNGGSITTASNAADSPKEKKAEDLFANNGASVDSLTATDQSNNNTNGQQDDGIEITHNLYTGVTTTHEANGDDDEASQQCQLWNQNKEEDADEDEDNAFGDIWSTEAFAFHTSSPLKDLLDSKSYTLGEILSQDELLQELRGCDERLLEYFAKPHVVAGLVDCLMIKVPYSNDAKGKIRWVEEESKRREASVEERDLISPQQTIETDRPQVEGNETPEKRSVLLDASSPRQPSSPHVEAQWKSPADKDDRENPGDWLFNSPNDMDAANKKETRSPSDEYDMRYIRYPYMACEVLCSEIGQSLNVLVEGYTGNDSESVINDDEDSLLGGDDTASNDAKASGRQDGPDIESNGVTSTYQSSRPRRRLLDLLFRPLIDTPPSSLDDRRAGYLEKLLSVLFRKHSQLMCDYMNTPSITTPASIALCDSARDSGDSEDDEVTKESNAYINAKVDTFASVKNRGTRPPMLLCALLDQLHSHSIMHVLQRLLMPSATRAQMGKRRGEMSSPPTNLAASSDIDTSDRAEDETSSKVKQMNNQFMNTLNQMNAPCDESIEEDDDMSEEPISHLFQCTWSESFADVALELLLKRLEGDTQSFLVDYGLPTGYDLDHVCANENSSDKAENGRATNIFAMLKHEASHPPREGTDAERVICLSQNASEILMCIIQNSTLETSNMTLASTDPMLSKLIELSTLSDDEEELNLGESCMSCAMTVLESLILQLGGYGAVTSDDDPSNAVEATLSAAPMSGLDEIGRHTPPPSPLSTKADNTVLIRHLPRLLSKLSSILTHQSTQHWTTSAQYKFGPRPLLGIARLRAMRLLEALVLLGDPTVDVLLEQSDVLKKCIELFWEFEWCSMLHQSVANLLVHVLEGGADRIRLQEHLIRHCGLLTRLMDSFDSSPSPKLALLNGSSHQSTVLHDSVQGRREGDRSKTGFGEMVLAMRDQYNLERHTMSSISSIQGSESSMREGSEEVAPVSEDDVDSAMEKDEEAGIPSSAVCKELDCALQAHSHTTHTPNSGSYSSGSVRREPFRNGYMGHVIIICQALVQACDNSRDETGDKPDDGSGMIPSPSDFDEPPGLSSTPSEDEITKAPPTFDDKLATVSEIPSDDLSLNSKKRKERSPSRDSDEDIKRQASSPSESNLPSEELFSPLSPIAKAPLSPSAIDVNVETLKAQKADLVSKSMDQLLRQQSSFERWQTFIIATLAPEMTIQSTSLGGQKSPDTLTQGHLTTVIDDDGDNEFLGETPQADEQIMGSGILGGTAVGIDMDENDLDVAASMMEALSLPQNGGASMSDNGLPPNISNQPVGHSRRRGVIGGAEKRNSGGIANFGAVIQPGIGGGLNNYVYDDPLGGAHPFVDHNEPPNSGPILPDAVEVPKESAGNEDSCPNKSDSESSDDADDDGEAEEDDEEVPVMDLFAGSFEANFANFDAFQSSSDNPFEPVPIGPQALDDDSNNPFIVTSRRDGPGENPFDLVDTLTNDT